MEGRVILGFSIDEGVLRYEVGSSSNDSTEWLTPEELDNPHLEDGFWKTKDSPQFPLDQYSIVGRASQPDLDIYMIQSDKAKHFITVADARVSVNWFIDQLEMHLDSLIVE